MTSTSYGTQYRLKITDDEIHDFSYYGRVDFVARTDRGATHLSVYAANGDAVSLTATINDW